MTAGLARAPLLHRRLSRFTSTQTARMTRTVCQSLRPLGLSLFAINGSMTTLPDCPSMSNTSTLRSSEERPSSARASQPLSESTLRSCKLLRAHWLHSRCHALCTSIRTASQPSLAFAPTRLRSTVGSVCAWRLVRCFSSFTISWSNARVQAVQWSLRTFELTQPLLTFTQLATVSPTTNTTRVRPQTATPVTLKAAGALAQHSSIRHNGWRIRLYRPAR
jgi:hypothetical protein